MDDPYRTKRVPHLSKRQRRQSQRPAPLSIMFVCVQKWTIFWRFSSCGWNDHSNSLKYIESMDATGHPGGGHTVIASSVRRTKSPQSKVRRLRHLNTPRISSRAVNARGPSVEAAQRRVSWANLLGIARGQSMLIFTQKCRTPRPTWRCWATGNRSQVGWLPVHVVGQRHPAELNRPLK